MSHLLSQLVRTEFKLRYQSSLLGYLWTLIKPLLLFGVIYLVFSVFLASSIANYALYLLLGIVIWTFFSEATSNGLQSLLNNRELISKISFEKQNLVYSTTVSALISLLLNLIVFVVFYLAGGFVLNFIHLFLFYYLALLALFVAGLSLILAVFFVRFHDLKHIWEVLLQILFWLTPIIYDPLIVPESYRQFLSFSPLAKILSYVRHLFFHNSLPEFSKIALLSLACVAIFLIGLFIFKKYSKNIAERI